MHFSISNPRFKQYLEDMFWIKYLKLERRPFVIENLDERLYPEPDPQPNFNSVLVGELLANSLKYTSFDKGDNSLINEIKQSGLAKKILINMKEELLKSVTDIDKDLCMF